LKYKNKNHQFGENAEYYVLEAPDLVRKDLKIFGLMFTKKELDLAHQRWKRKGSPKTKRVFFDRFLF